MFTAHVKRLDAVRAARLLDQIQVQAVPHMKPEDRTSFLDMLRDACRGVVAEVERAVESVVWNGKVLGSARQIKGAVAKAFGAKAVA